MYTCRGTRSRLTRDILLRNQLQISFVRIKLRDMDQVQDATAMMQQWRYWAEQLSTEVVTKQAVNYLSNNENHSIA